MTLPRLYALSDYWEQHPPVHMLVAAYMGFKAEAKPKQNDLGELISMLGGGNGGTF